MYFDLCIKCKIGLPKYVIDKVNQLCQTDEKVSHVKQIIEEYLEKIKDFPERHED